MIKEDGKRSIMDNDKNVDKPCGIRHAKNPIHFHGVSTPIEDRTALGIRGLIPSAYLPLEVDVERCMARLREKCSALEKYIYLRNIQDTNEQLYYAMLVRHITELMPIVYTPTVGEACQRFSHTYKGTLRGFYISLEDKGMIRQLLDNWSSEDVTTIVVTDGERILGLGDLGVNGIGIPIGKMSLYTACGGIKPSHQLPVIIDVGTNNEENLSDPYYLGLRQRRVRGPVYDELIQEFFEAAQDKFGKNVLIQFEDFGNINAFRLLEEFKGKACTFNDDIQGTAAVALAGIMSSSKVTGKMLSSHTYLFLGAGEAGAGIADLIAYAITKEDGSNIEDARKKIFMVDSKGLITSARKANLRHHKVKYAHDVNFNCPSLISAIEYLKPSVLIGVSAVPKAFDKEVCEMMAANNSRPIIFALSNPTLKAECTAEEAYTWTDGQAIFCSGSPFGEVTLKDGRTFKPGQGNNVYIFPGIGLGTHVSGSTAITDHDMYLAAQALASKVTEEELMVGSVYPPLHIIREVSAEIAATIAENAYVTGVATKYPKPNDLLSTCKSAMYDPFDK